jgi:hypothetical protein
MNNEEKVRTFLAEHYKGNSFPPTLEQIESEIHDICHEITVNYNGSFEAWKEEKFNDSY